MSLAAYFNVATKNRSCWPCQPSTHAWQMTVVVARLL